MNKERKRVAFLYLGKKGAGNTYSIEMARAMSEMSCDVMCVLSDSIDNRSSWDLMNKKESVSVVYVRTYNNLLQFFFRLINIFQHIYIARTIRQFNPDCIYIPMFSLLTPLVLLFVPKIKVITTIHDLDQHLGEQNIFIKFLSDACINRSSKLVILSEKFTSLVSCRYHKTKEDIIHIPHANFSCYANADYKPDFNIIHNRIMFFGRIIKYKGLEVLLQAMKIVIEQIPDLKLRIAGDGEVSDVELSMINELGSNVELEIRWIQDDEVSGLFTDVDMAILPYIEASQSGVIPLAYGLGKCVVATNVGGLSEQLYPRTGELIEPSNPELLAQTVIALYKSPQKILSYNKESYRVSTQEMTWSNSATKLFEIV